MKRILLFSLTIFCCFSIVGCNDDDRNFTLESYLLGQWACVGINGNYFATDSTIFYDFNTDGSAEMAFGTTTIENNGLWNSYTDLDYAVDGNTVTITTNDANQTPLNQKLYVSYITNWVMVCDVVQYDINSIEQTQRQQLLFERVSPQSYAKPLVGIWQTPSQNSASSMVYREFLTGGVYNYYVYNTQIEQYTQQVVGQSNYELYGNYIVLSYVNQSTMNQTYKCWKIRTAPSNYIINWLNEATNGNIVYQQLINVDELPTAQTTTE